MRFEGKSVLITGAASGFGRIAAHRFAAEGARLTLGDVNEDGLAETVQAIGSAAVSAPTDVSREADQRALVALAVAQHGGLDIALNNAGAGSPMARLPETDVAEFDRMMAINARSVFLGMKYQLPVMADAGGGAVLNTASAAGLVGAGMLSAYAASKHAVVGLTRAAADEYARHAVRINAICPSFATTPLFDEMADEIGEMRGESREAAYKRISSRIPMRRVAKPEEIVEIMLMLCDPANTFMTGQAVSVDGGLTAV
ncbi:MAG: SDR family oxidoreductase [Pseudomonadota bacterium]